MKTCAVYKNGVNIIKKVTIADTFFNRLIGLMPQKSLDDVSGIILKPCKQVHTFHMSFSIDAIFLSDDDKVLYVEKDIMPNKVSKYLRGASAVLEVKSGVAEEFQIETGNSFEIKYQEEL